MADRPKLRVFVATKGHAFARDAFEAMLRAVDCDPTFVDQPAAAALMNPNGLRDHDALLLHDMWGLDFRAPIEERPGHVAPDPAFVAGFEALVASGKGIVAIHHALAGWPAWPRYAELIGGSFRYKAVESSVASGFAGDISYDVAPVDPDHPVVAGLAPRFTLTDEPYRHGIATRAVLPLLRIETAIEDSRFQSAESAVRRQMQPADWTPPPATGIAAWAAAADASPLVYIQPGDGPQTFADPNYRRLVGNALRWVTTAEARAWVAACSNRSANQDA
ncbi:ThuA domain-containing protein [Sphingomonas sp. 1P06PA]|uniref:ThuA domain-containing protein n=1 Tax=Sphingomonas sp. 1P06PA TaxID=554121 RepID=UPI0039A6E66D